jgi:signal transduction histidine kinase
MRMSYADKPAPPQAANTSLLVRAGRIACFAALFGIALAVVRRQDLWYSILYSLCIAMICWVCIDLGRLALARALARHAEGEGDREWPGWPWMIVLIVFGSAFGYSTGTSLGDWLTGSRSSNLFSTGSLRESLTLLLFALVPAVIVTYFFYSRGALADRVSAAEAAQRQAAESRLKLLESQLEPHMLFNTLANLRVLIALDPARAQAMLDQLIAFLRATLGASRVAAHSLRAEFERLADYLALIQVRMADRLTVGFDLPEALADVQIPPLLLQPLVENSVKHGLEAAIAGGRIEIAAARDGDDLLLRVRDTGIGLARSSPAGGSEPSKSGAFGLAQVRERLATLYGPRASLCLSDAPDARGGTLAIVRLPLENA